MRTPDASTEPREPRLTDPRISVMLENVSVSYEVYEDRSRRLRELLTGKAQRRPQRRVEAVRDVSLVANRGEAVGIIGRNGSGKSTLLRAIAGLLPPDDGVVRARSIPVLLSVSSALQPNLSGRRNIVLGGTALGFSKTEILDRMDEIIEFAGLQDFIDMPLRTYSSGMAARLQFSISSIVRPEILLIDEALAVGDMEFKYKSEARIRELIDEAGTVFLVSHGLHSILRTCDRAIWLDHGEVMMDSSAEEVVGAYREASDTE